MTVRASPIVTVSVVAETVVPSSVTCAIFTFGCGQEQQFWTVQVQHRARVVADVLMSSKVFQVIPDVVGLIPSEPRHRLTG